MAALNFSIYNTRSATDTNAPSSQGVAVSSTSTFYSDVFTGLGADGYGLQLQWTGTPNGTFTLWMSDKLNPGLADDTDWVQDTTFAPTNPAGAAGKFRDDASNSKSLRKRIKYVNSSSAGTLFGWVTVSKTA